MDRLFVLKNNIRIYREKNNLTQTMLGQLVCVSKNSISCFENGNYFPSAYTAALLCKIFECKFEDLFYLDFINLSDNKE